MTRAEKAQVIMAEINESYAIPVYMEKYVTQHIIDALEQIEAKEKKGA